MPLFVKEQQKPIIKDFLRGSYFMTDFPYFLVSLKKPQTRINKWLNGIFASANTYVWCVKSLCLPNAIVKRSERHRASKRH